MSDQIQTQAAKVWETIAAPETGATFQKTGSLTWTILKETGYLLWLVVCLGLVASEWIWKTGYRTGYGFRDWLNNFERPSPDLLLSATGQSLLGAGKTGFSAVILTAKNQLGIEPDPEPIAALVDLSAPSSPTPAASVPAAPAAPAIAAPTIAAPVPAAPAIAPTSSKPMVALDQVSDAAKPADASD